MSRSVDETLQYKTRYRVVIVSTKMYLSDRKMTWNTAQTRELRPVASVDSGDVRHTRYRVKRTSACGGCLGDHRR